MEVARSIKLVSFHSAPRREQRAGLLGWLCIEIGAAFVVDGIALRRTRNGRLALSFPTRTDTHGRRHPVVRPRDAEAHRSIAAAVLGALEKSEGVR